MATTGTRPRLAILPNSPREFKLPKKEIDDGDKVEFWLNSKAHSDIMTFLLQLNIAMFPTSPAPLSNKVDKSSLPEVILGLQKILERCSDFIKDAPPDPGPRRFGNISYRHWYTLVETSASLLLSENLPKSVIDYPSTGTSSATPLEELKKIFLGSFGSSERLDYGTGHELSFLAFLAAIWKLHAFENLGEDVERQIVLGVLQPYFALIRRLIFTYNLEPAGSHGVWGLDDHVFLPYIFGSAQLSPKISEDAISVPQEGSVRGAPKPTTIAEKSIVEDWRELNLYFGAIGFINDVKTGPFWEHSPMLYDISGVTAGWAKINKGMLKMFQVEVLSKFPVVQHFPFGSIFEWEVDPNAAAQPKSIHIESQPTKPSIPSMQVGTQAPWVSGVSSILGTSRPPTTMSNQAASTRMPPPGVGTMASGTMPPVTAPWASANIGGPLPNRPKPSDP